MSRTVRAKSARRMAQIRSRLRVMRGDEIALGPGRVDLLELIGKTGSLRKAAQRMGLSYMRAWKLIKFTNRSFAKPLVEAIRGGQKGGGAELTDSGARVLKLYRSMEAESQRATQDSWGQLRNLLR